MKRTFNVTQFDKIRVDIQSAGSSQFSSMPAITEAMNYQSFPEQDSFKDA